MSAVDQAFIRAYEIEEVRPPAATAGSAAIRSTRANSQPTVAASTRPLIEQPLRQSTSAQTIAASTGDAPNSAGLASTPSVAAGRRPLSAFAQSVTVESKFKPSLEVDRFHWSMVSDNLLRTCRESLAPAVQTLLAADDAGRSLIGISASSAGAGCTTVLACLARLLVDAGKSIAIVDANFNAPGVATHLGVVVDAGWEEVLAGNCSLAEAAIHSIEDRLTLIPLVAGGSAAAAKLDAIHASVSAGILRYHYDMVLFDLGATSCPTQGPIIRRVIKQCRLDGALVATSLGIDLPQSRRIVESAPELATICLGVIQNQLRAA